MSAPSGDDTTHPAGRGGDSRRSVPDENRETTARERSNQSHRPERADDTGDNTPEEGARPPHYNPPTQDQFDWRGWLLVGIVVVSFLFVPWSILYIREAQWVLEATGLSWRQAYLTLPMIPALLLGATAIWAAVRSRSTEE